MNFYPVKNVKETFSRACNACEMNFDPLSMRHIFFGLFLHVFVKIKFDPLLNFSKNELCATFVPSKIKSGSNDIWNTRSVNRPKLCDSSQVDQNFFRMNPTLKGSPSHI